MGLVGALASPLVRHDAAPQQVADSRAETVDLAALVVEAEAHRSGCRSGTREPLLEALLQLCGLTPQLGSKAVVLPHLVGQLGHAHAGVKRIALHLRGGDRRRGDRPVVEAHGVPRVAPRLGLEASR